MKKMFIVCLMVIGLSACNLINPLPKDTMSFELLPGVDTVQRGEVWEDAGCEFIIGETILYPTSVSNPVDTDVVGEYVVTYTIIHDGFTYEAVRHVMVVDRAVVLLELLPGIDSITVGDSWVDGGINVVGADSENVLITVDGTVDTSNAGRYSIIYTVTDSLGGIVTIERVVTVSDPIITTITFVSNGGSNVASLTQEYATTVVAPVEPSREHYTFGGWYIDQALTTVYIFTTMPSEDITLYAKWNIDEIDE